MTETAVITLLREIAVDLHAIRQALERGPSTATPVQLLSVLYQHVGDNSVFSSTEVIEHAFVAGGLLQTALLQAGIRNPKGLGKYLSAQKDITVDGRTLRQDGGDNRGAFWYFSCEFGPKVTSKSPTDLQP